MCFPHGQNSSWIYVYEKLFMRNFKKLEIWQYGYRIAVNCFKITESFSYHQKLGLGLQINKSGISIPSNIAEGSGRDTERDYNRFIEISLGSSFELETQLLVAQEMSFGNQVLLSDTLDLLSREEKMLLSFSNTLKK